MDPAVVLQSFRQLELYSSHSAKLIHNSAKQAYSNPLLDLVVKLKRNHLPAARACSHPKPSSQPLTAILYITATIDA